MPCVRPNPRFSHGGRTLCPRHGRQLVCCGRCVTSATERGGKWSLDMPAVAYGYPSVDIALLAVKCWQQSLCALISDHILEENSLHLEQIKIFVLKKIMPNS